MTRKNRLLALVLLVVAGLAAIAVAALTPVGPLPADLKIIPPDPSLPAAVKSLSGKWTGKWSSYWGGWDCLIIVEKIDKDSAQVVHAWGEYQTRRGTCHCAPDWRRIEKAKVICADGKASLEFKTPPYRPWNKSHIFRGTVGPEREKYYTFSFELDQSKPDLMVGRFISAGNSKLFIDLKKID